MVGKSSSQSSFFAHFFFGGGVGMALYCDVRRFQHYFTILNAFSYPTPMRLNLVHRKTPY